MSRTPARRPIERSREFGLQEMFFSTTDRRGIITAGNGVFTRTSGFGLEELVGQPHNIIRHPDMPRAVFALLWQRLAEGVPFCGYVKNMAKDGAYYWVLAVIAPIASGYVSIRMKPSTPWQAELERAYASLRAAEQDLLAGGQPLSEVLRVSSERLATVVRARGFANYDLLSHSLLNAEMRARDEELARRRIRLFPEVFPIGGAATRQRAEALYGLGVRVHGLLSEVFAQLATFETCSTQLEKKAQEILELSQQFRLNALNANIASAAIGRGGRALSTVAGFLSDQAAQLSTHANEVKSLVRTCTTDTERVRSHVAFARMQIEMLLVFQGEMVAARDDQQARLGGMLRVLDEAFASTIGQATEALAKLSRSLPHLSERAAELHQAVMSLQLSQVTGLTESAQLERDLGIQDMFRAFRQQIDHARQRLNEWDEVLSQYLQVTADAPQRVKNLLQLSQRMRAQVDALFG